MMRQTTLLGFFKPQSTESIIQSAPKAADSARPDPASFPLERGKDASLETIQEIGSLSSRSSSSSNLSLSAIVLAQTEVVVPTHCPEAAIVRVRNIHLPRLKSITSVLLPVRYPDRFFNECLHETSVDDFCRVLLWNAEPIGWIRCRVEPDLDTICKLYIQAIGVLAPYRGSGFATMLLDCIIQPALVKKYNIGSVYAHVWEENKDACRWYERRDFKPITFEPSYYRRLRPAGAWVMTKTLASRTMPTYETKYEGS